jgi:hypothetical protein
MPDTLVLAADMSDPAGIDAAKAAKVRVILGYVGGVTPHAWSRAEVQRAVDAVGAWWPIWTAPNPSARLTASQGAMDGAAMVAGMRKLGVGTGVPCFYDIERSTYDADSVGARAAWQAWQAQLDAAGWSAAWPYVPTAAGYGWLANWTGHRPTDLPAGVVGVQFEGASEHSGYDLSVFDLTRIEDAIMPTAGQVAAAVWGTTWPDGQGKPVPASVWLRNADIYAGRAWLQTSTVALTAVVKSALASLPTGADPDATAAAVVAALGKALAPTPTD